MYEQVFGDKSVYQQVNPDEKEWLKVFITGNENGQMPPPMAIFRYKRFSRGLALSVPQTWGKGRSENGWMTGETFFEFVTNLYLLHG